MSRISNDLAGQIAQKLTEKSRLAYEKLHLEFRELATSLYEEQTPDEVKKCLKNNPDWVYTRSDLKLDGHGFNWEWISPTRPLVSNTSSGNCVMKMTAKIADQLIKAKNRYLKAKSRYEDLKTETKQALLTLKTFNNIRKELPEAAPMLPPPISNALVVNFSSLKKQLAGQPEIKKETVKA